MRTRLKVLIAFLEYSFILWFYFMVLFYGFILWFYFMVLFYSFILWLHSKLLVNICLDIIIILRHLTSDDICSIVIRAADYVSI